GLAAFAFDAHFAGAGENLAGNEERQNAGDDPITRNIAAHQVVGVATVAVARIIGVVLVYADLVAGRCFLISATCPLREDTLARFILGDDLLKSGALGRRILRVGVIVVESSAV